MSQLITLEEIQKSREILSRNPLIRRTPMMKNLEVCSPFLSSKYPQNTRFHCKLEMLQTHGSFKTRGTSLVLSQLTSAQKQRGLVTMSAGNFARSFSSSCATNNINGVVCMPKDVPIDRIKICESFSGIKVVLCERERLMQTVTQIEESEKRVFVHPFDDLNLFRGYGSIGLEVIEDINDADVVVCGVGGGGLIAGIASALRLSGTFKGKIYGVEPTGADSMYKSMRQGTAVKLDKIDTFVNGLAPPFAGPLAYKHVKEYVDDIILVDDNQVRQAMKLYFDDFKLVVEPAGAATLAAVMFGLLPIDLANKSVVLIASGGNVSLTQLSGEMSKL